MGDYGPAILIDAFTLISCVLLLFRYGDLRFSHPGTPYILFHFHTVSMRLIGLAKGAMPLYANTPGWFEAVRPEEITRAALYADLAFWSVTAVWVFVKSTPLATKPAPANPMRLDPRILRPILLVAFLLGVVGLRIGAQIPGVQSYDGFDSASDWSSSSYLIILPSWFGLAILGHMYYYGARRITAILLATYLVLMSIQGGMRFRVIAAGLLAVSIWVERRNRRWPSRPIVISLVVLGLLFFPMKDIGRLVQKGASLSELTETVSDSVSEATEGSASDHLFLDEFASALTLLDMQGRRYYGSIYLPILTLPIPRALWPEKPGLSGFVTEISTRYRPMSSSGMITTYMGESYANFGVAGIFIVPPLLAYALVRFRRAAYSRPYDSLLRFFYTLLSVNLIQVYRDGLLSLIVFTFVNMMPLVLVVFAHIAFGFFRKHRTGGAAPMGDPFRRSADVSAMSRPEPQPSSSP